jgi:hypothetical protein
MYTRNFNIFQYYFTISKNFQIWKMCPNKWKYAQTFGKYGKCSQFFFENFGIDFQSIVILGFYSNVKGMITMETSVWITMEADVTMDLCSKATMKTKSVSIEGWRSTVQFTARSRRDYTHFVVIRESVVLVLEFYRNYWL